MIAGCADIPETVARIDAKSYGEGADRVEVLGGLVLPFATGRFNVLIGPSGCGKTTALRIVSGLDRDFDGILDPALAATRMGFVFQDPRLLPWRDAGQNVALAARDRTEAEIFALLDAVGLRDLEHRFPSQLSLGQARRVALARAFAVRPDLLLLDEPFVSLDETTAQRLRALLLTLWEAEPATVVMVTHNVREAVALADRLIVLTGRPSHVAGVVDLAEPRSERDAAAIEAIALELQSRFPGLIAVWPYDGVVARSGGFGGRTWRAGWGRTEGWTTAAEVVDRGGVRGDVDGRRGCRPGISRAGHVAGNAGQGLGPNRRLLRVRSLARRG